MMAILCVEGNVPPGDFMDVLDYEDSLLLAEQVQRLRTEERKVDADNFQTALETISKGQQAVVKQIGELQKMMGKIFR